jgi:hypothetical protein
MLKKLIAYQKLLTLSNPPFGSSSPTILTIFLYSFVIATMSFMNIFIFFGNTWNSAAFLAIPVPIIIVWMTNRVLYGNQRLFETVPVSRKYTALNIFFFPLVTLFITYIMLLVFSYVGVGIIIGIVYLISPKGFSEAPPESAVHQIIDTSKGDLLMIFVFLIIIFAAMAIIFIKNKKLRLSVFAGFATIGYGLLILLKLNMPISPNSDKVEFLESFSIMPEANAILICVAISTAIISIMSVLLGCKLYVDN